MNEINIVMAQLNFLVGDIDGNTDKIIDAANTARDQHQADVIIFPELAICGYPPEDLLLRKDLYRRVKKSIQTLCEKISGIDVVVGYPCLADDKKYNCAGVIQNGKLVAQYHKMCLPNYSVFDEERYFDAGEKPLVLEIKGVPTAITVCEDLWHPEPARLAKEAGAELIICINASPYARNKPLQREQIAAERAQENKIPIIYVNMIGGQDELVFDGGSMVLNEQGEMLHHAAFFEEALEPVTLSVDDNKKVRVTSSRVNPEISVEKRMYDALVLGVRDYIEKNRFKSAIIGLSGGIDSALTLAIAVDAIGNDKVEAIMMPSQYTSDESVKYADEQAKTMGVEYHNIGIEKLIEAFLDTLADEFKNLPPDVTEENIQARCRGIILMAISNKKGAIVLSTGNKSELSVGYSTLYGDMVGGFCVLKDVPKHWVYRLANYRNNIERVIPQDVIDRPPSAELAPNQKDQDTLPPYDILDQILEMYVEEDRSPQYIIDQGFNSETVKRVVKMVDRAEYKRHQSPVGVRISQRGLGKDRRYPITSGYHDF